jgi:hypothetical protein
MPIRARVGRHTRDGGRHCQNWSDDQQTIVNLLNSVSIGNGGTGGSLKPRIVAGMAAEDMYKAIVAFEDKYFPGQRSGYFDPGGKMYTKLEALAAAAVAPTPKPSVPAPPPPSPPPPPPPLPDRRPVTGGETTLLMSVFDHTLPFGTLTVARNVGDIGGVDNSLTPGNQPWLATSIWCADFSDAAVSDEDRSTFIHEFVHVWQYYHGITKLSAIWLAARHLGDYEAAYAYDLSDEDDLTDFNIEQQASIIEDWWRVKKGMSPLKNTGSDKSLATYTRFAEQMRNAGPPHTPLVPTMRYRH